MGLLSVVSRLGAACAPWVAQWLGHVHHILPFSVMGGLTLLSALTLCWLKETRGKATKETLDDSNGKCGSVSNIKRFRYFEWLDWVFKELRSYWYQQ